MKKILLFSFLALSLISQSNAQDYSLSKLERSLILNQEMNELAANATTVKVWSDSKEQVSATGIATSDEIPQIDSLEKKYFSDKVQIQESSLLAQEDESKPSTEEDDESEDDELDEDETGLKPKLKKSVDGRIRRP